MKRGRVRHDTVPLLCLGLLLAACGDKVTGGPGGAASTPGSTPTGPIPTATRTTPPQEICAAFLPSAPCDTYGSISGAAGGKDLPWAASRGVKRS